MNKNILKFNEININFLPLVGGKGANLGELSKIAGINVPDGFCITTDAYKNVAADNEDLNNIIAQMSGLKANETEKIKKIAGKARDIIENLSFSKEMADEISKNIMSMGENQGYAVRSSATAEDLPNASFAGQHDTYLNIIGIEQIIEHIKKCWASLFTERAITYRIKNSFSHKKVYISVVVQKMIFPQVAGIMFTADPITSNRKHIKIDASYGLGEALVSGLVNADSYTVKQGKVVNKKISTKSVGIYPMATGGTLQEELDNNQQKKQALSDKQILELADIGKRIENHFECPQDIEWCLQDGRFYIVQSRPITTLYPLPNSEDGVNRVYLSAGHMQMMTDTIKPLGMFFFNIAIGNDMGEEIGGRLYLDMSNDLSSFIGRKMAVFLMKTIGEELMLKSVKKVISQKDIVKALPKGKKRVFSMKNSETPMSFLPHYIRMNRENNPDNVKKVIEHDQKVIDDLRKSMQQLQGEELFRTIEHEQRVLKNTIVTPESVGVLTTGLLPDRWINKKLKKWLNIDNAADTLTQCVPNSITTDMGFDLLYVSDAIRKYPEVIEYLENAKDKDFFEKLEAIEGGAEAKSRIKEYLKKYGMRCSGDVDITRERWGEKPTQLVPIILSNIKNYEENSRENKFNQGLNQSTDKIKELIEKIEKLPGGRRKAKKMAKKIGIMRNHIGYREYPKHAFVERYYIFKKALLKEAQKLVEKNIIKKREDIYYLHFEELRDVVAGKPLDYSMIDERRADYKLYEKLSPPRIMTLEEGAILSDYDSNVNSESVLCGIPVSAGVVEGRARVIHTMEDADIDEGDILVTSFTDPSWTPIFVSLKGLVTEVGGLTTHGAIIAREYGLPAVVSVGNATTLIKDGDMIRLNGTEGYVEILES